MTPKSIAYTLVAYALAEVDDDYLYRQEDYASTEDMLLTIFNRLNLVCSINDTPILDHFEDTDWLAVEALAKAELEERQRYYILEQEAEEERRK